MATIEQRAKDYSHRNGTEFLSGYENAERDAYIQGATDQHAIDLAHAKAFAAKWLDEIINIWLPDLKDEPYHSKALNDIYNKLEKAMKQ